MSSAFAPAFRELFAIELVASILEIVNVETSLLSKTSYLSCGAEVFCMRPSRCYWNHI